MVVMNLPHCHTGKKERPRSSYFFFVFNKYDQVIMLIVHAILTNINKGLFNAYFKACISID